MTKQCCPRPSPADMAVRQAADAGARDVRVGVIGCGRIAQAAHLPAIAKADGVTLAGVCDASEQLATKVAARNGVPCYTAVERLLPECDAVVVAVPDRAHHAVARAALQAGKHVLVEKPLAMDQSEAEELAHLAARYGLCLQVGAMKRHDPGVRYAAAVVQRIGRIHTASFWYRVMGSLRPATEATLFPVLEVDEQVRHREGEHKSDRGKYLLRTHGAHAFDTLRCLAGDVVSVSAQVAQQGRDYSWHTLARLASGGLAHVEITADARGEYSEGADIYGEFGHIALRSRFPFFRQPSDVDIFIEGAREHTRPTFADTDPFKRQMEAFAAAITCGRPITPDASDGIAAVRLIAATADSATADGAKVVL